jgi:hypothetical protein
MQLPQRHLLIFTRIMIGITVTTKTINSPCTSQEGSNVFMVILQRPRQCSNMAKAANVRD